jgi:hypothetical protein
VTTDGRGPTTTTRTHRAYTMDGATTVTGDRLRTVISLGDRADGAVLRGGGRTTWSRLDDTYGRGRDVHHQCPA